MKAIIKIYLCFFLCISTIIGCTKEETIIEKEETNKESFTSVSFAFKGEVLNITESPLTKAADYKDWYAFQVYSRTEGSSDSYRYYAGFFDNIQDMVINLKDGYEYKFDVFMLPEGSRRVALFSLTKSG